MANFTHFNQDGEAIMVDVSQKDITMRIAIAEGSIKVNQEVFRSIKEQTNKKGDVLAVARIAGIMAAKKTSDMIPLCHPLFITKVTIDFELDEENCIVEMKVPQAWVGKTLSQLDLRKLYSINVLGKRNPHTHKLEVPVDPNLEIELNDTFLVLAQTDEIEKYDYLL